MLNNLFHFSCELKTLEIEKSIFILEIFIDLVPYLVQNIFKQGVFLGYIDIQNYTWLISVTFY